MTAAGVFFAMRPKAGTNATITYVGIGGTLNTNKTLGVSVDLYTNLDTATGVGQNVSAATSQYDEIEIGSGMEVWTFTTPPTVSGFRGRPRSARAFWCNNTTESATVAWAFGLGQGQRPLVLRGQNRWMCLATSDIADNQLAGSIVYPNVEWTESV